MILVSMSHSDESGCTPLWKAACNGYWKVIELLIASGRDLGDINQMTGKEPEGEERTALEIARERGQTEVIPLLERFMETPIQTRHELRVQLGFADALAAELYAVLVFLCDELLQFKPASLASAVTSFNPAAVRFFAIAKRLPMELQMVLCHVAVGSAKDSILSKDSEAAFKSLARVLLLSSEEVL